MTGCSAIAGASRSLRSSPSGPKELAVGERPRHAPCRRARRNSRAGACAGCSRSAANTSLVGTATPGLTSTAGKPRQIERRGQHFADAAHHARPRIEADRHVGAGRARRRHQPRIVEREPVGARQQPQRRRGIGRAAAEAGRHRQALVEHEAAELQARDALGERARRLEHQIVGERAGRRRRRPAHRERQRAARREASARRRPRRTPPGFRGRDSRRRAGRGRAA